MLFMTLSSSLVGLWPGWDLPPALQHTGLQPKETGWGQMAKAAPSISRALQSPVLPSAASLASAVPGCWGGDADVDTCSAAGSPSPAAWGPWGQGVLPALAHWAASST